MGSADVADCQRVGKGLLGQCIAIGAGCRCAETSGLCPQKRSQPGRGKNEGWRA